VWEVEMTEHQALTVLFGELFGLAMSTYLANKVLWDVPPEKRRATVDLLLIDAFGTAYDVARGDEILNLVPLAAVRARLGAAYGLALTAARVSGRYVLHTHDGRHGPATAENLTAVLVEDGRRFVYVARRAV
jgi:hypothetical protein